MSKIQLNIELNFYKFYVENVISQNFEKVLEKFLLNF